MGLGDTPRSAISHHSLGSFMGLGRHVPSWTVSREAVAVFSPGSRIRTTVIWRLLPCVVLTQAGPDQALSTFPVP